ncbi:nucleolin 2-like [Leptopilina heterotoma]|uniref:nucleolin 2-like n=1 Tax=Leptopilina heterotoma TaxID=63436 RepID=UPI001CA9285D|nr:nucleolin 2-like [Leptopilina heterotoma]
MSSSPNKIDKIDSSIDVKPNKESINENSDDDDFVSFLPKKKEIKSTIDSLISAENENTDRKNSSTSSDDLIDDNDDGVESDDSDFEKLLRIASSFWDDKPAAISKLKTEVEKGLIEKCSKKAINNDDEEEKNEEILDEKSENVKQRGRGARKRSIKTDNNTSKTKGEPAKKRKVPAKK